MTSSEISYLFLHLSWLVWLTNQCVRSGMLCVATRFHGPFNTPNFPTVVNFLALMTNWPKQTLVETHPCAIFAHTQDLFLKGRVTLSRNWFSMDTQIWIFEAFSFSLFIVYLYLYGFNKNYIIFISRFWCQPAVNFRDSVTSAYEK